MKKILALMAAAALTAGAVSCGKKAGTASQQPKPKTTEAVTTTSEDTSETTTASTTTAITTTTSAAASTSTAAHQPDPLGGGAFEYNDDGAVVFTEDSSKADDKTLMAAAQALFQSACRTEMKFTVGCPFEIDNDDYIENDLSWRFYRVTDSRIHSFSDVLNEYHKVFSDSHSNDLASLYMYSNGSTYALCGNRGANIYYSSSRITEIKSKSDNEIVFTVENYYDGDDFGQPSYTETDEFSVVIGSDNVWKAEKFNLPY
ncbi:MAG: hypothetical protein J6X85_02195 [Ruminococcus sp.]|nr:hypothetical protein [Ruminococcus sp.]